MKLYYDNDLVKEIEWQILSGNNSKALVLADEYMELYPSDTLAPIYRARALACNDRLDEAIEIFEDTISRGSFHNVTCEIIAHTWYGSALHTSDLKEKAIEEYKKAISFEDNKDLFSHKARIGLINAYISLERYDEALKIINDSRNLYANNYEVFMVKKGIVLLLQNKPSEALKVLKSTKTGGNPFTEQQLHFTMGRCYFALENYDEAYEQFANCLSVKSNLYYQANGYIGSIKFIKGDTENSIKYANIAATNKEASYEAYKTLVKAYLRIGSYDKAKEILDKMPSCHITDCYKTMYLYQTGQYEEAIKLLSTLLSHDSGLNFRELLIRYIDCIVRLGKYEEAKYILDNVENHLPSGYYLQMGSYIYNKLGLTLEGYKRLYSARQIYNYSEEEAIKHITAHHTDGYTISAFSSVESATKLYHSIKDILPKYTPMKDDIFDTYLIPYTQVGFDKDGSCNTICVIVIPGTYDIITMYPFSGADVYDEEEEKEETKVVNARPSQLDKFNARFAKYQEKCGKK